MSTAFVDRQVPGYIEAWYAGQEGGTALAETLFGNVNPSGHLPATFERAAEDNPTYNNYYPEGDTKSVIYKEGIFVGYRGYEHNKVKPLFPFGYGLSYTTFKFSNLVGRNRDRLLRHHQHRLIAAAPTSHEVYVSRRSLERSPPAEKS